MTGPAASIVVIGAGPIGSFLAARLHLAGEPVELIARGQRLESLWRDGLRFDVEGTPDRVDLPVGAAIDGGREARLVLFCTKAGDLTAAIDLAAPVVGAKTVLTLVQNGVEAPAMAAAHFPGAAVIASRIHGFFELDGDLVRHVGVKPSLELGLIGPEPADTAREFTDLFNRSGIDTRLVPDMADSLWSKFLLAASLGGVALACRLPAGRVPRDPSAMKMLIAAMAEVRDIAIAEGIMLSSDIIETTLAFAESFPSDATTSLQRDVLSGRNSEYDFLPGAVLRLGRKAGVGTPCFDRIEHLVRTRDAQ